MNTLDSVLDEIMQLSPYEKQILLEILNKRVIEERRDELSAEIKEAISLYRSGKLKTESAEQIISRLHNSLDNDE